MNRKRTVPQDQTPNKSSPRELGPNEGAPNEGARVHARDLTSQVLIEFDAMPWNEVKPGVRVKEVVRGRQRIRLLEMSDSSEPEWCVEGHVGLLLSGCLDVEFDEQVVRYHAGHGLSIPSGEATRHRARVPEGMATLLLVESLSDSN